MSEIMKLDVIDINGKKSSSVELGEAFSGRVNKDLFYEVVKMQQANRRAGTASTKTRSEVSGGGAKPWNQKGSGRARAGTTRSPLWRHGGTCFGPKPRDYSYSMPKKAVKGALRSAVTLRANDGKLKVFEAIDLAEPRCKGLLEILKKNEIGSALIVGDDTNRNLALASRNLKGVKFIEAVALNVYDVLRYEELVMTKAALTTVQSKVGV